MKCDICGREFPERDMFQCSPSPARPKWRCWECYKHGHAQAAGVEIRIRDRRIKEANKK